MIILQKKSLDIEEFEFIVYDDSIEAAHFSNMDTPNVHVSIKQAVEEINATYKRIPGNIHRDRRCLFPNTQEQYVENANTRCSDLFQWMFRDAASFCSDQRILFLDADVHLISPFHPTDFLSSRNASIAATRQFRSYNSASVSIRMDYLWNAVSIVDMKILPGKHDFNSDCMNYLFEGHVISRALPFDVGGRLFEWIDLYFPVIHFLDEPLLETKPHLKHITDGLMKIHKRHGYTFSNNDKWVQLIGDTFVHLRNGGNWNVKNGSMLTKLKHEEIAFLISTLYGHTESSHGSYTRIKQHSNHTRMKHHKDRSSGNHTRIRRHSDSSSG